MPARKRRRYERVRRRSRLRGSISLAGGIFTLMSFHNMNYKVKIDTGHFFIFSGTAKRDCYPRPKEDIVQFRGCLTTYCTHHPISWAKDRQTQLHQVHIYHCEQASTDSLDSAEEFHPVQINLGEVSLSIGHRMMMMVAVMIISMLV